MLHRLNMAHVLRVTREHGPLVRSSLVQLSGLSRPTVNDVLAALLAADLVTEAPEDSNAPSGRPGPRARVLAFNARRWLVVGVDVGAAKTLAILADLEGHELATARRETAKGATAADMLSNIRAVVSEVAAKGAAQNRIAAVAVGTPGVVDPVTGTARFAPQLPGWDGIHLQTELGQLAPVVLVESEAHLAVLAEHWQGAATGVQNAVYIQAGVGVGMGVLIDGSVYRGAAGAAGEIGYLPFLGAGARGTPSDAGAFEAAVGADALSALAQDAIAKGEGETILAAAGGGHVGPAAVFGAANDGDPVARGIVDTLVERLGLGVACVAAVLNPEVVVIGGGLAAALGPELPGLREQVARHVPIPPRIELTVLGDRAVALGAVRRAIEQVEDSIFDDLTNAPRAVVTPSPAAGVVPQG
jgi:predicted NBD/HSP70 family sugar kinase